MKIGSAVRPGHIPEKKMDRTGQVRTVKQKSHKVVIFHLCGKKPPLYRLEPKFAWRVASLT